MNDFDVEHELTKWNEYVEESKKLSLYERENYYALVQDKEMIEYLQSSLRMYKECTGKKYLCAFLHFDYCKQGYRCQLGFSIDDNQYPPKPIKQCLRVLCHCKKEKYILEIFNKCAHSGFSVRSVLPNSDIAAFYSKYYSKITGDVEI